MSDYSDFVTRLRDYPVWTGDCHDAADSIEAQAKRISELEAALKPFAEKDCPDGLLIVVNTSDLRKARKVLENA